MLGERRWFYFGSGSRWKFSALSSAEVTRPHLSWFACSYSVVFTCVDLGIYCPFSQHIEPGGRVGVGWHTQWALDSPSSLWVPKFLSGIRVPFPSPVTYSCPQLTLFSNDFCDCFLGWLEAELRTMAPPCLTFQFPAPSWDPLSPAFLKSPLSATAGRADG